MKERFIYAWNKAFYDFRIKVGEILCRLKK